MKQWKYIIRVIGILLVGLFLVKMTYQFKRASFMFDLILFGLLSMIGLLIWAWSVFTDLKEFRLRKAMYLLFPSGLALIFTTIICIGHAQINSNFAKPTLMQVFYAGDFNGINIDFKTDGTYIMETMAIGLSTYTYGSYELIGNTISLKDREVDKAIVTNQLEIRSKVLQFKNRTERRDYACQIDENGNLLANTIAFSLVIDNR